MKEDWKNQVCQDCIYFTGEECDGLTFEGSLRDSGSPACDEFEEDEEGQL